MSIHVVNVGVFPVDATGHVIDKRSKNTTIGTMSSTSSEHRIIPDIAISTSANYPTIKAYLEAEESAGYLLQHMDQSFIVTRKP